MTFVGQITTLVWINQAAMKMDRIQLLELRFFSHSAKFMIQLVESLLYAYNCDERFSIRTIYFLLK